MFDKIEMIEDFLIGSTMSTVLFLNPLDVDNYVLNINLFNEVDGSIASMYGIIVTEKTQYGFTVEFSSPLDSVHYKLAWNVNADATFIGSDDLVYNSNTHRVNFGSPIERSEEHTSELQSHSALVCRLLLEKKKFSIKLLKDKISIHRHKTSSL